MSLTKFEIPVERQEEVILAGLFERGAYRHQMVVLTGDSFGFVAFIADDGCHNSSVTYRGSHWVVDLMYTFCFLFSSDFSIRYSCTVLNRKAILPCLSALAETTLRSRKGYNDQLCP